MNKFDEFYEYIKETITRYNEYFKPTIKRGMLCRLMEKNERQLKERIGVGEAKEDRNGGNLTIQRKPSQSSRRSSPMADAS